MVEFTIPRIPPFVVKRIGSTEKRGLGHLTEPRSPSLIPLTSRWSAILNESFSNKVENPILKTESLGQQDKSGKLLHESVCLWAMSGTSIGLPSILQVVHSTKTGLEWRIKGKGWSHAAGRGLKRSNRSKGKSYKIEVKHCLSFPTFPHLHCSGRETAPL